MSVQLSGLEATTDRMDRVEDCLARFRSIWTDSGLRRVQVRVGAMSATIDNPESLRAQLLQARLEPLREVSALENIPVPPYAGAFHLSGRGLDPPTESRRDHIGRGFCLHARLGGPSLGVTLR